MRYLLLHAFPFDGSFWSAVADDLRGQGHEVMAPDLPGFGRAPLPDAPPSLERVVDGVVPLLGGRSAIVVGCSLGGYVALAIAQRAPSLIEELVLIDTKATADGRDARANRERIAREAESGGDWSAGMIDSLLGATTRARRPDLIGEVGRALQAVPAATVAWMQRAMADRPDRREILRTLGCPVTVVWGDEDTVSPWSEQDLMLAAVPDARLHVIDGAGHLTPIEAPQAVAQVLRLSASSTG